MTAKLWRAINRLAYRASALEARDVAIEARLALLESLDPDVPDPDPDPDPVPPTPPLPTGQIFHTLQLPDGDTTIIDTSIKAKRGVNAENNIKVTLLQLERVDIESEDYGIYLGNCDVAELSQTGIVTGPGNDSYCLRGQIRRLDSTNCTFDNRKGNKACWRVYGCANGGISHSDTYLGGRMMIGGGSGDERVNPGLFHNFAFVDGKIAVASIDVYPNTHDVDFNACDFTGSGKIGFWGGCTGITFKDCTKDGRPLNFGDCQFGADADGQLRVTADNAHTRGIAIT